jgi:hypothetical protein
VFEKDCRSFFSPENAAVESGPVDVTHQSRRRPVTHYVTNISETINQADDSLPTPNDFGLAADWKSTVFINSRSTDSLDAE